MITTTLFPGRYVQGPRAMSTLGDELARFGPRAMLIVDPYILDNVLPPYREDIEKSLQVQVERFGGESSDEEIERLTALARSFAATSVAGIGGGKTLDTAKTVAWKAAVPAASVPTAASTDAPTSALAVIYTPDGIFKRYQFLPTNPTIVLVDSEVVTQAPLRFLVAGMGDALATWFEAESCRQSYAGNMTGKPGSATAYALARLCYDTLLQYGTMARQAAESKVVTPAVERIVEANTLLSGLGFESGGLAAAHAIHNGFTTLEATHEYPHGEKVAVGTLASLFLTDKSGDQIEEVYYFCESVGLPTTLPGIGLESATDEDLMKVAQSACAEGETIHNEPRPVSPEDVLAALKAADAHGRVRQKLAAAVP
ncbi:MAG: glycerol dehydrogenase [Armatimonadia bacterium]